MELSLEKGKLFVGEVTKHIVSFILLACIILAIQKGYSQDNVVMSYSQESKIRQQVTRLVRCLPDHSMSNSPKEGFEPLFYEILTHAFSIPSNGIGEIGKEDWLYYFVSGNDDCGCTNHPVKILTCNLVGKKIAYVELNYHHRNHFITLQYNGFDWVISDFDNVRNRLVKYINEMRTYYFSNEWFSYVLECIDDDDLKEYTLRRLQEIDEYFRKYPHKIGETMLQTSMSTQQKRFEGHIKRSKE